MRTIIWGVLALLSLSGSIAPGATTRERFFSNGRRQSRELYVGATKVGHHETWWPNGIRRSSAHYANDAFHGELRTWRENGHPYELRHFDHGRESGLQQSWNDDGSLYLNYVVRDGRRYGFINAVPCLPADRSGKPVKGQIP